MYYLKEWTPKQIEKVEQRLLNYFRGRMFKTHRNTFQAFTNNCNLEELETILGLPYTSTSSHAMMSMDCNVNLFHDNNRIFDRVVMDSENNVVIILRTNEEKETSFKI